MIIDEDLPWKSYIKYVNNKITTSIPMICKAKTYVNISQTIILFFYISLLRITGTTLSFFQSYLTDRRQYVVYDKAKSDSADVEISGVV